MSKPKGRNKVTSSEGGVRRTVWVSNALDILIEDTRKKLGMNRSTFYKYAVTKLLQELLILSKTLHEEKDMR